MTLLGERGGGLLGNAIQERYWERLRLKTCSQFWPLVVICEVDHYVGLNNYFANPFVGIQSWLVCQRALRC